MNPNTNNVNLAEWIKQSYNLVIHPSRILKWNIDDIVGRDSAKRQRTVRYPELENALLEWILQSQDKIILTDNICLEKAKVFAQMLNIPLSDFKFPLLFLHINIVIWNIVIIYQMIDNDLRQ